MNATPFCALIVLLSFTNFLLPLQHIKTKYLLHTFHTISTLHLFVSSSLSHSPFSLGQFYATDHSWEPAELYCEFIIIQLGFLNSHILSTDGSNCETLSERTDHLCLYHKLLSLLPLPLKANRWNCSYVHRQLAHCALIYSHTAHIHMQ